MRYLDFMVDAVLFKVLKRNNHPVSLIFCNTGVNQKIFGLTKNVVNSVGSGVNHISLLIAQRAKYEHNASPV